LIRDLQRIQIKIASNAEPKVNLEPLIAIFARWRKETNPAAEWVDLADYAHMVDGPGVMLIGHRCYIGFDLAKPLGVIYAARKGLTGGLKERIASTFHSCFEMTQRLIREPEFPKNVALLTNSLDIRFNDRLATPNNAETDMELRPVLTEVLNSIFGTDN